MFPSTHWCTSKTLAKMGCSRRAVSPETSVKRNSNLVSLQMASMYNAWLGMRPLDCMCTNLVVVFPMRAKPIARNDTNCINIFQRYMHRLHRLNFLWTSECQIMRRLVTSNFPVSPGLPLLSSIWYMVSNIFSPACRRVCLPKRKEY